MATELKLRRGTTSQHSTFTGAEAEATVDTDKNTIVVHDGQTQGGSPLATEGTTSKIFNSVADMQSDAGLVVGQFVRTLGYSSPGDGGGNDYEVVAAGTGTDDGGSFIDLTSSGHQAKGLFPYNQIYSRQFGWAGDGSTSDETSLDNAQSYAVGFSYTDRGPVVGTQTIVASSSLSPDSTALNLRAGENEIGTKIVFWKHPSATNSTDRLAQITAHGDAVGSLVDEMAFYTTKPDGSFDNKFKVLANTETSPFILTGCTGVSRSSGLPIKIGENVVGGGTSTCAFQDRVGIQANSPDRELHIAGNPSAGIKLEDSSNGSFCDIISSDGTLLIRADQGNSITDNDLEFHVNGGLAARINKNSSFLPGGDAIYNIGASSVRWDNIYAANGTIQTSDKREKQQSRDLEEKEFQVAREIKTKIKAFKWNYAVERKGENARWHFGVMAQEVSDIFNQNGLDPDDYGLFCYDEWETEFDSEGNVRVESGSRYGIRYDELNLFLIAAL